MDITLISKARFDALMQDIKNLENQVQMAHTQLKAMQETNNNFADIAFDENRFTDELISRCEEAAREAASDAIDIDDIASKVSDELDVDEEVSRALRNMDVVGEDKVTDLISDYIRDNSIMDDSDVDSAIGEFIDHNYEFVEKNDVEDMVEEKIEELKESIVLEVLQLIANKLTERREATPTPSADLNGHTQPNAQ